MSDRDVYCDRDDYERTSSEILLNVFENSLKDNIELEYLIKYKTIFSEYLQAKLNDDISNTANLKSKLAKLETSNPIQSILLREKHPCENIIMEFGKIDGFLEFYKDAKNQAENNKRTLSDEEDLFLIQIIKNMSNKKTI